jgi:hypothetical protein
MLQQDDGQDGGGDLGQAATSTPSAHAAPGRIRDRWIERLPPPTLTDFYGGGRTDERLILVHMPAQAGIQCFKVF